MADYMIGDVCLHIPDKLITTQLDRAFASGRFEHSEAAALQLHLRPKDSFLDLGAGCGFLLSLAAKVGARQIVGVEAGYETAQMARDNLARNGGQGEVLWGAVVPDDTAQSDVVFSQRRSFWASSLTPSQNGQKVVVPAVRFNDVLSRFSPSVVCIDIEGGEEGLFQSPLPDDLRLIVMELHPKVYGAGGIKALFDRLSSHGFCYCPSGSTGGTVVFQRLAAH